MCIWQMAQPFHNDMATIFDTFCKFWWTTSFNPSFCISSAYIHSYFQQFLKAAFVCKSLCTCPSGCSTESQTQHVHFLMHSPPDRANDEWKNLAKLVRIQINSPAWGSSALRFYKCDPQITSYEPQTSLTSLFLKIQIFEGRNQDFLHSTFLWPCIRLQMISPQKVFCALRRSSNVYRGGGLFWQKTSHWVSFYLGCLDITKIAWC